MFWWIDFWIYSHFLFLWSATYNCSSKQILILVLTDSLIINIIHIIHTVLDIKSKQYKWSVFSWSCFPVNNANFLRTAFSIEHLCWLLLCPLEREEEKRVDIGARKNFSNERRKWKYFIWLLPASFGASHNRNANATVSILKHFLCFYFV